MGYALPQLANVHSNPLPLLLGGMFLLPGSAILLAGVANHLVPETLSGFWEGVLFAGMSGINFACWYVIWRLIKRRGLPVVS